MCGRFVIASPPAALRQIFGYIEQPNFPPRYNVAPTQPVPVVLLENGGRHFRLMRWGLIPSWVKEPRKFSLLINARSETILEKPAFKNAIKRRRCLIPADGYYEWQDASGRKRPFFIHRRDGRPVGFAALAGYREMIQHDGEKKVSRHFVILCFAARWLSGEPVPELSEISEAAWRHPDELQSLETTQGLAEIVGEAMARL